MKNHKIRNIFVFFVFFISLQFLGFINCSSAVKSGRVAGDPFPEEMLGHKTFLVFKSGDINTWLGRIFRNESRQIMGEKLWEGTPLSSGGERREIEYSREQSFALKMRMPHFKMNLGELKGNIHFNLVLRGLKIHQLSRPVMINEFRDDRESRSAKFIISLLHADEISMQAVDSTGALIGFEGEYKKIVLDANYKYSKKHKGIIVASDAIIGYSLVTPKNSDFSRR